MARVKRAQVTTMQSPVKPASITSATKRNGHTGTDLESAIRARAYELFERRGRYDGYAQDDWLQAEAEVLSRVSRTA
jgi:Protein of unknown function (DUF2934)